MQHLVQTKRLLIVSSPNDEQESDGSDTQNSPILKQVVSSRKIPKAWTKPKRPSCNEINNVKQ